MSLGGLEILPTGDRQNKLVNEKSPYLLQHAENPVDWYPWGVEAFEKAEKEDKPIFLSIGYSTCHWCHVMAHESFEDDEVAKLMNEAFVSMKVDREERPDIDNVYMKVCQMMTGSGGWPLTIIMAPDKKPFFAATYIPKTSKFGRAGMVELIPKIKDLWSSKRKELTSSADQIVGALQDVSQNVPTEQLDKSTLDKAYSQLDSAYDEKYGGFRSAPKFPTPHNLLFLLRYWMRTAEPNALAMTENTLDHMRLGGVYDHIGFGFHRYSTDPIWFLPHFEKMLYDQALLAMAYTEAYQATKKEEYARTAHEIFTYVLRDMTSPEGGFYSAEDADSEGEEGKFYAWSLDEVNGVLSHEEAQLAIALFGMEEKGNFREEATGKNTGANVLHMKKPLGDSAVEMGLTEEDLRKRLETLREKLFDHREDRIHPHKDDKILTDWNGLMIAAFAKGAQALAEEKYAKVAKNAIDFIMKRMRTPEGRLLHRYRDGEAGIPGHVDDYAFLIWGLLETYEATFDVQYLEMALELDRELKEHFWDEERGGYYSTADDAEEILVRSREIYDGAIPSGNSVSMLNLLRLGRITADLDFEDRAARLSSAFSSSVVHLPTAYTQLMVGLDFALGPSHEVVIVGDSKAEDTEVMVKAVRERFIPSKVLILRNTDEIPPKIDAIAEFVKNQSSLDAKATAYVCTNNACKSPTTDPEEMLAYLIDPTD